MKKTYGMSWQGSKSKVAEWVLNNLPKGGTLCDLFAGGCAVTHAAMLRKQFNNYIVNDVTGSAKLFRSCVAADFPSFQWVGREKFKTIPEEIQRSMWAFNGGASYLYCVHLEPLARALYLLEFDGNREALEKFGITGTRKEISANAKGNAEKYINWYLKTNHITPNEYKALTERKEQNKRNAQEYLRKALEKSGLKQVQIDKHLGNFMSGHYFGNSQWFFPTREQYGKLREILPLSLAFDVAAERFEVLKQLPQLPEFSKVYGLLHRKNTDVTTRINRLKTISKLNNQAELVKAFQMDYQEAARQLNGDAVFYCDIPYENTEGYGTPFDYSRFYEWAQKAESLVVVSSYEMGASGFVCIAEQKRNSTFNKGGAVNRVTEKLFIPERQKELYKSLMEK